MTTKAHFYEEIDRLQHERGALRSRLDECRKAIAKARRSIRKLEREEWFDRMADRVGRTVHGMRQLGFSFFDIAEILSAITPDGTLIPADARELSLWYYRRKLAVPGVIAGDTWEAKQADHRYKLDHSPQDRYPPNFTPWEPFDHFNFAINQIKVYR